MTIVVYLAILLICSVLTVELLLLCNLFQNIQKLNLIYRKVAYVIGNKRISDHWKEKVIPRYAVRIFGLTSILLLHCVVVFSPIVIISGVASFYYVGMYNFIISWIGILYVTTVITVYAVLRKNYVKRQL